MGGDLHFAVPLTDKKQRTDPVRLPQQSTRGCGTKIFRVQRHSEWNREREFSPFAARCRRARAGRFRAAANPCAAAQPLGEPGNFAVLVRVHNFLKGPTYSYLLLLW